MKKVAKRFENAKIEVGVLQMVLSQSGLAGVCF
jgi:hypothetical protein